jgi:hypothetical protein
MPAARFIVGEISKTWERLEITEGDIICRQFEQMIAYNLSRGYLLHSFQLNRIMESPTRMNETLIAVFERLEK